MEKYELKEQIEKLKTNINSLNLEQKEQFKVILDIVNNIVDLVDEGIEIDIDQQK